MPPFNTLKKNSSKSSPAQRWLEGGVKKTRMTRKPGVVKRKGALRKATPKTLSRPRREKTILRDRAAVDQKENTIRALNPSATADQINRSNTIIDRINQGGWGRIVRRRS